MTGQDASVAETPKADLGRMLAPRHRWTVRSMMVAIAVVAVTLFILRPVYFYLDATCNGPSTRAYDRECKRIANATGLVGKSKAETIRILGEPAEIWEYDRPEGPTTTLAYCLSQFAGVGTFQVHCRSGIVRGFVSQPE